MKKLEKPVLAEGEVTGHAHVLEDPTIEVFEGENGLREFQTESPTRVVHEEHNPIEIPVGNFASGKVLEFDHFAEEARQVRD